MRHIRSNVIFFKFYFSRRICCKMQISQKLVWQKLFDMIIIIWDLYSAHILACMLMALGLWKGACTVSCPVRIWTQTQQLTNNLLMSYWQPTDRCLEIVFLKILLRDNLVTLKQFLIHYKIRRFIKGTISVVELKTILFMYYQNLALSFFSNV